MNKITIENNLIKLILKICPKVKKRDLTSKKINLVNDGYLDSFDIIQIIREIEKIKKKKVDPSKIKKVSFKKEHFYRKGNFPAFFAHFIGGNGK